jgi:hypothetical protein
VLLILAFHLKPASFLDPLKNFFIKFLFPIIDTMLTLLPGPWQLRSPHNCFLLDKIQIVLTTF